MANYKDIDPNEPSTHHEYDGIKENDNPLPGWWLATFYLTIGFSILYYAYYQLGSGPNLTQEYEKEHAAFVQQIASQQKAGGSSGPSDSDLAVFVTDANHKKNAEKNYKEKCSSCHGQNLEGSIGPNLTDDFWIHGGKLTQIVKVIKEGVAAKGMPPWAALLKDEEVHELAGYIKSKRGSNPPNAKAPQGDKSTD